MKPETEIYTVAFLDMLVTKLDNILDDLNDEGHPASYRIEKKIMDITMEVNGLVDRLTEESHQGYDKGVV